MSAVPANLKYTKSHEWIKSEGEGVYRVGITQHAQELLGDIVFIEMPEIGRIVDVDEECAVVESAKSASEIYAPLAGEIISINESLESAPELANQSPYEQGWLFCIKSTDALIFEQQLSAADYETLIESEE